VIIPPTPPFIFLEMVILAGIVILIHAKSMRNVTLIFSLYGIVYEIVIGGLRGAPLPIVVLLAPYVGLGYAFVSMLPLNILLNGRAKPSTPTGFDHASAERM